MLLAGSSWGGARVSLGEPTVTLGGAQSAPGRDQSAPGRAPIMHLVFLRIVTTVVLAAPRFFTLDMGLWFCPKFSPASRRLRFRLLSLN